MYFHDRVEAGKKLTDLLLEQKLDKEAAVLAVSPGGVIVGNEIAKELKLPMGLLLTKQIAMPGVSDTNVVGLIDQDGHFTHNNMMPTGLLTEFLSEMHTYVESQKLQKLHEMTHAVSAQGAIDPVSLRDHHVIVVSDGFKNALAFEAAVHYLKTVATKSVVAAAPNVSVSAVDRLHVTADKLAILDVLPNYLDTDHYFEDNILPDIQTVMNEAVHRWQ